jgi:hypothetical protein
MLSRKVNGDVSPENKCRPITTSVHSEPLDPQANWREFKILIALVILRKYMLFVYLIDSYYLSFIFQLHGSS